MPVGNQIEFFFFLMLGKLPKAETNFHVLLQLFIL